MILHQHQSLANVIILLVWAATYLALTRRTVRQRRASARPRRRVASTTGTMRVRPRVGRV